jgi:hypothetical protein
MLEAVFSVQSVLEELFRVLVVGANSMPGYTIGPTYSWAKD